MSVFPVVRDRQVAPRPLRDVLADGERDGPANGYADDRTRVRDRTETDDCEMCPGDKSRFEALAEMTDGDRTRAVAALGSLRAFELGELSESEFRRRFRAYTAQELPSWWFE